MLYSASKAALNNLCEGASEYFRKTRINFKIINPKSFKSKMLPLFVKKKINLTAEFVARNIVKKISEEK